MANLSARFPLLLMVIIALVALAACQESPPTAPPAASVEARDGYIGYLTGTCDRPLHAQLEDWYEVPPGTLWRHYSAVLDCAEGDEFVFTPAGWGTDQEIRIFVPAGAVSPAHPGYPDLEFTVAVPAQSDAIPLGGAPETWTAVPFIFSPSIDFLVPVTVTLAWPAWAEPPADNGFDLVNIGTEIHEEDAHYRVEWVRNAFYATAGGPPAPPVPAPWTNGIGFQVDHFSRWTLVNGDDPDGGGVLEAFGVDETEHCWTDLPPDPDAPRELIR